MSARTDLLVVGAGAVGATAALALRRLGYTVQVLDAGAPVHAPEDSTVDPRVFALSPASITWLQTLGLWPEIAARAQDYGGMRVWDAVSGSDIAFDAASLGLPRLGAIVENQAIVAAAQAGLDDVRYEARLAGLEEQDAGVRVQCEDGAVFEARYALLADGAGSPGRSALGIRTTGRDYGGRAVVCHVQAEYGHDQTAWQRFLPNGPVALLPLFDGRVSVVWSTTTAEATSLLQLDDSAFAAALTEATAGRLGACTQPTARLAFALRRQTADRFTTARCVLLGDAAHVVHPLAGQGVNLGFDDARALVKVMGDKEAGLKPVARRRYERQRRAEIARMSLGIDALDRLFSTSNPALAALRGAGLHAVDVLGPVKRQFAEAALGAG